MSAATQRFEFARRAICRSGSEKAVLWTLVNHCGPKWSTVIGQQTITEESGVSLRTVNTVLNGWEASGKLRRERRHRQDGSRTSDRIWLIRDTWDLLPENGQRAAAACSPGDEDLPAKSVSRESTYVQPASSLCAICADPMCNGCTPLTVSEPSEGTIPARGGFVSSIGTPNSRSPSPKPKNDRAPRMEDLNPAPCSAVGVAETWTDRAGVRIRGIPRGSSLALVVADVAAETGVEIHELGAAIDWAYTVSGNTWYAKRLVNVAGLRELAPELVVAWRQANRNGRDEHGLSADTRAYLDRIGLDVAIWRKLERREPLTGDEQAALEAADQREKALARS